MTWYKRLWLGIWPPRALTAAEAAAIQAELDAADLGPPVALTGAPALAEVVLVDPASDATASVRVCYTNHRGETAWRRVTPYRIFFGTSEWHPEPQWLLDVHDHDKGGDRTYAMSGIVFWPRPGHPVTSPADGPPRDQAAPRVRT
jgi:predicted DNA-binding transcriptional regulator YafY